MYTFGQLKSELRLNIFPAGEAENLVAPHDKAFIDALTDLQTWVACLQVDNTSLFDQCSTLFNCGLTVLTAPRGIIRSVSVVDRLNQTTGKEDATLGIDWCSELFYEQADPCCVNKYLSLAARMRCCPSIPLFFNLTAGCCGAAGQFNAPTDAGVDPTLPILPLGYHYPQASTDRSCGRATAGRWSLERGKIYVLPWIQSTETVIVKWDGNKRSWNDGDPIDDDPLLKRAVEEWVRADHAGKFDKDPAEHARATAAYAIALANLIHQCNEETRVRSCEPSQARGSNITNLFFNEAQSFTATCPEGETGSSITVNIPAGSVGSPTSIADANQRALNEAQSQAEARLDCSTVATTFTNDQQSATASCTGDGVHPPPDGNPVTVIIPAGQFTSTVSKADANAQALAAAQAQAAAQLSCTFWNSAQTASCPTGQTGSDVTVAAHTFSSTLSQADADSQALTSANNQLVCTGGGAGDFWNTEQIVQSIALKCPPPHGVCNVVVQVTVLAHVYHSSISQADANQQARNLGSSFGATQAAFKCSAGQCGTYDFTIP